MSNQFPGSSSPYYSPALGHIVADPPHTLCAHCPAAVWYQQSGYRAFCHVLKILVWAEGSSPVTVCDGFEVEAARLNKELEEDYPLA